MRLLDTLIQKIDKIVLLFALVVLTTSLYLVHSLNQDYRQKETIASLDTMLTFTKNMLDEEQQHALSLALLLSENQNLLRAYFSGDRQRVFDMIARKIKKLEQLQGYHFEVQVHDRKLHTYLRSWDYSIRGVPLAGFREGLVLVRKTGKPMVSIEVGKRLNIKAIAPIVVQGQFRGSIETITGFDHLQKRLAEQGYRLYVLLDKQYLPIATTLQRAPKVGNAYRLVGSVEDREGFAALQRADLSRLERFGYFSNDRYLFGYFDLRNYHNERVGYLMISPERPTVLHPATLRRATPVTRLQTNGVVIR